MMKASSQYIDDHVTPKDDEEAEYLRRLGKDSQYLPQLLFSQWPDVLRQAEMSPAAAWKVMNLKKRPSDPASEYPEW